MKAANCISSIALGESIEKINRKREERLIFEAAFIMLSCMCKSSGDLTFTEVDFLESYPHFSHNILGSSEFKSLLRFRNVVKVGMHLIPPVKNKDHLLDLVTRLVEGKLVKHVSGSGATKETQRRTHIILTEGNLTVNRRPPRKIPESEAIAATIEQSGENIETQTKKRKESSSQALTKESGPASEVGEVTSTKLTKKKARHMNITASSFEPIAIPSIISSRAANVPKPSLLLSDIVFGDSNKYDTFAHVLGTARSSSFSSSDNGTVTSPRGNANLDGGGNPNMFEILMNVSNSFPAGDEELQSPRQIRDTSSEGGLVPLPQLTTEDITRASAAVGAGAAGENFSLDPPRFSRVQSDDWYRYPLPNAAVGSPLPKLQRFPSAMLI